MSLSICIAPLSNISSPTQIELGDKIELHKLPEHLKSTIEETFKKWLIRSPFPTHCAIIRDVEITRENLWDARTPLEEVVLRLRIYKEGSIQFNIGLVDSEGWYDDPSLKGTALKMFGVFYYVVWGREGLFPNYELTEEDIEPLQQLFKDTKNQTLMEKPAFRFFFNAYHEPLLAWIPMLVY